MTLQELLDKSKRSWEEMNLEQQEVLQDLAKDWPVAASKVMLATLHPNMNMELLILVESWEKEPIWVQMFLIYLTERIANSTEL